MKDLKIIHDLLLEKKPEEANHEEADCPFCKLDDTSHERGEVEEFTKEQLDAAVAEATAPLIEQIESLKAEKLTGEADAALVEKESELSQVKADLDAKVLEVESLKSEAANVTAYLESVAKEAEEAARIEEAKGARLEAIKSVADFPEDYIEANVERWAAMDQADFDSLVESYSLFSAPKTGEVEEQESASFKQVRPQGNSTELKANALSGILAL